ncbi:MAG TPA: phosphomannomutase CpsG [Steroidobacteraceae bacterium]|nr:phosphomannomutase CpsG [Steroidobacteraceae bacterium]
MKITSFKAYDVRGRIPDEFNEDIAYRIGRAFAEFVKPKRVAVGRDIRPSSGELRDALIKGLTDSGVDVFDIGLCGTEGIYFATFHESMDGGVMITASHNPPDYNGVKMVRERARPLSADTGLEDIRIIAERDTFQPAARPGQRQDLDTGKAYLEHLLTYVARQRLKPLKIVVNAGNGGAGMIIDQLEKSLPFEFIKLFNQPDGRFPNGVPNPMLEENRAPTIEAIRKHKADLGIAWDGDYDRCFFFDEGGHFIEGYYIVGLLASVFLRRYPGAKIVHDPRLTWNTVDIVKSHGGVPVLCKSGHAFIKEKMRNEDAVYGGEMSAHHYFRDFSYADSGMIPWLLVTQIVSESGKSLSALVDERIKAFPASGEINRKLPDGKAAIQRIEALYKPQAVSVDYTDGLSLEFERWRFNLRTSNTEPLVRLNVESRGDEDLMKAKTQELLAALEG